MRRGYILTWDAVIAFVFVFIILSAFLGVHYSTSMSGGKTVFERLHVISEDAIGIMDKGGILDRVGLEWSKGNYSNKTELESGTIRGAPTIAKNYLDMMIPTHMGYRVELNDTIIYSTDYDPDRMNQSESHEITRSMRLVLSLIHI